MEDQAIYLDNAATTPVDPRVAEIAMEAMTSEFGNAGSRTHRFGLRAKTLVEGARSQVADALGCTPQEVIFTSGATESNNLAILGMAAAQQGTDRKHIISTAIEHKSVLEPLAALAKDGFEVDLLAPDHRGWISPEQVAEVLRPDTALVSVMHVNNETGIIQPISGIGDVLDGHPAILHIDASQGFLKTNSSSRHGRVDLLSLSGHKIHAPKGIGALMVRSRDGSLPISNVTFGGDQERGLRPGTLPVHLIAALGKAVELGQSEFHKRRTSNIEYRKNLKQGLALLDPNFIGDQELCIPNILCMAIKGIDSEALILSVRELVAISNGSACNSHRYQPSHVLQGMGVEEEFLRGAVRLSWDYDSESPDWELVRSKLETLR